MEINQLLYFLEVAKQKSFTGASKSLYVSQPAISKMIRMLEDELGVLLFNRSSHYVELTDYGIVVQGQVQKVVQAIQDIQTELNDITNLQKGDIRIGIPPMVGEMFFSGIIGLFHQQYPNIRMKLFESGSKAIEAGVEDGNLDVGVAVLPVNESKFEVYEIAKSPIMLIVNNNHPLSNQKNVKFSDLKDEEFVLYRQDFGLYKPIYDACIGAGFEPNIVCETSQWEFMVNIVSDHLGIAFLPLKVCEKLSSTNIKIISVDSPPIYWHLGIIWRKGTYLSQASRSWINFAKLQVVDITKQLDFWNHAVMS
ncbi:MAG: LysR family transcriptional regulator [Firmicutes bacterium]|nr:LysR family transcriptional regulator [Bacillota bacterium]